MKTDAELEALWIASRRRAARNLLVAASFTAALGLLLGWLLAQVLR